MRWRMILALLVTSIIMGPAAAQSQRGGVPTETADRLASSQPQSDLIWNMIGLLGLIQLAVVGAAGLLVAGRTQVISVPALGVSSVVAGLVWFVLGFVLYAMLYAAGASLVSRHEDLAAVTAPLSVLVVGTYLSFFWVIANPATTAAAVLSVLPPFAPILMPARMATGDASAWQVALAIGLALAFIAALNVLAARIYSNSVLRLGSRVSLRQAWSGTS